VDECKPLMLSPRVLSHVASYDMAGNICQSVPAFEGGHARAAVCVDGQPRVPRVRGLHSLTSELNLSRV